MFMNFDNRDRQAPENKLSEEFVEFIDLTDEDLEEVEIRESGGAHGGCDCGYSDSGGGGYYSGCENSGGGGCYCGPES
jgi:uncharacterized membrane protein